MYDVTSNELDKIILGQNNLPFVNPMMISSCLLSFNPDYVTYTHFLICIGAFFSVRKICRESRANPPLSPLKSPPMRGTNPLNVKICMDNPVYQKSSQSVFSVAGKCCL